MAATPENKVKKQVKALLDKFGAYHHWPVQAGYGAPCLDCHGVHKGTGFAVETKAPGKTLTPRQKLTKASIEAAGGKVFVVGEILFEPVSKKPGLRGAYANDIAKNYSGMHDLYIWLCRQ